MAQLSRGIGALSRTAGLLVALLILLMMLTSVAEVARRYLLGTSFVGTIEFVQLLVTLCFFLGMSYTQVRRGHLRVELLVSRLPPRSALALEAAVWLLALAFYTLMLWQGGKAALASWEIREYRFGAVPFPLWPAKIGFAIGVAIFWLQLSVHIAEDIGHVFIHRGRGT